MLHDCYIQKIIDNHPLFFGIQSSDPGIPDTATKAPPMRPCRVKHVCSKKHVPTKNLHKKKWRKLGEDGSAMLEMSFGNFLLLAGVFFPLEYLINMLDKDHLAIWALWRQRKASATIICSCCSESNRMSNSLLPISNIMPVIFAALSGSILETFGKSCSPIICFTSSGESRPRPSRPSASCTASASCTCTEFFRRVLRMWNWSFLIWTKFKPIWIKSSSIKCVTYSTSMHERTPSCSKDCWKTSSSNEAKTSITALSMADRRGSKVAKCSRTTWAAGTWNPGQNGNGKRAVFSESSSGSTTWLSHITIPFGPLWTNTRQVVPADFHQEHHLPTNP